MDAINDIEHTRTKVRHPQASGSVERLDQTIQDYFHQVALRKKPYRTIEEIQANLDAFMDYRNQQRTNQGRCCQGRTPFGTFLQGLELYQRYVYEKLETGEAA